MNKNIRLLIFIVTIFFQNVFISCAVEDHKSGSLLIKYNNNNNDDELVSILTPPGDYFYPEDSVLTMDYKDPRILNYLEFLAKLAEEKSLESSPFRPEHQKIFLTAIGGKLSTDAWLCRGKLVAFPFVLLSVLGVIPNNSVEQNLLAFLTCLGAYVAFYISFYATGDAPNAASVVRDEAQELMRHLGTVFRMMRQELISFYLASESRDRAYSVAQKLVDKSNLEFLDNLFRKATGLRHGSDLLLPVLYAARQILIRHDHGLRGFQVSLLSLQQDETPNNRKVFGSFLNQSTRSNRLATAVQDFSPIGFLGGSRGVEQPLGDNRGDELLFEEENEG